MSLYDIKEEYRNWEERMRYQEGETTPEDIAELEKIEASFEEKSEAYAVIIRELELKEMMLTDEIARLSNRAKRLHNHREEMTRRLSEAMLEMRREKVDTGKFLLSFRTSKAVLIDDAESIPESYINVVVERKPLKTELAKALKVGAVPGCHLEERKNLQIK